MAAEKIQELNELEQFLRQEDAVMEPNILSVLRRYISDEGNPATVVEMLSDNYAGALKDLRLAEEENKAAHSSYLSGSQSREATRLFMGCRICSNGKLGGCLDERTGRGC